MQSSAIPQIFVLTETRPFSLVGLMTYCGQEAPFKGCYSIFSWRQSCNWYIFTGLKFGCFNGDLFDGASSSSLLSQLSSLQKVSYSSSCLSSCICSMNSSSSAASCSSTASWKSSTSLIGVWFFPHFLQGHCLSTGSNQLSAWVAFAVSLACLS